MSNPLYGDKVIATSNSGLKYTGWYYGSIPEDAANRPGHHMVVLENTAEAMYFQKDTPMEVIDTGGPKPDYISNMGAYIRAYNNSELELQKFRRLLDEEIKSSRELESKHNHQIAKAFEVADRAGYCDEVLRVATEAGIPIPEKKIQQVRVRVSGYVTVEVSSYTKEDAAELIDKGMVEDAIESGSDRRITEWEVAPEIF